MLKNHLKISWRNLKRAPVFSTISVIGLAAGITSCLLILLFVNDEFKYDRSYPDVDRLYRIALERSYPDRTASYAVAPMPVAHTMVREYPEVDAATRIATAFPMTVRFENNVFQEQDIIFADSTFFNFFGIKPLEGDPDRLLNEPWTIVLTPEMANKYFGDRSAVGKQLTLDIGTFTVMGVVPKLPRQSHFHYDFVASMELRWLDEDDWLDLASTQYIRLTEGADPKALEEKLPGMIERYAGEQVRSELGLSFSEYLQNGNGYNYFLQPVKDIHLYSNLEYELEANGNIAYIYLFSIIVVAILVIAGVNYVNTAAAQATTRAREVGVRKTLGSGKKEIASQFLLQSLLTVLFALVLAIVLIDLLLPFFNQVTGKEFTSYVLIEGWFIGCSLGIGLFVGLAAGLYPAFMLSAFRPVEALRGRVGGQFSRSGFRRALVIFQFTMSIILLVGMIVVMQQINFAFNKNLGFEKEQRLVIERAGVLDQQQYSFMQVLSDHSKIFRSSRSNGIPGYNFSGITIVPVEPSQAPVTGRYAYTDDTYLQTYGIDIIKGRPFSRDRASDSLALIVNEKMAEALGKTDPVGMKVRIPGDRRGGNTLYTIVGVMENFHHESIHKPIGPIVLRHDQGPGYPLITVHIEPQEVASTIDFIEETWSKFVPGQPFSFFFFDQHYNELYNSEIRTSRVLSGFTLLSILLTCLGMFGLSAFAVARRRKEIGIHKVYGASVMQIVLLLTREYTKLVILGLLIATPIAWYGLNLWLAEFAYRIDISPAIFIAAGGFAIAVTFITVSWQTIRAALANPVDSLRSE